MVINFLQLNSDKTEAIIFGPTKSRSAFDSNLGNLIPYLKSHGKDLGIIFHPGLRFDKQICSVVKK